MAKQFSDRDWRIKQFMIEQEQTKASEGDERLDKMIQSMNDYVLQLTTTLGAMPNYVDFIRKPNDPAKTPEQNQIDKQTVVNALNNLKDNTDLMNKMYSYFKKYIDDKYNFTEKEQS